MSRAVVLCLYMRLAPECWTERALRRVTKPNSRKRWGRFAWMARDMSQA